MKVEKDPKSSKINLIYKVGPCKICNERFYYILKEEFLSLGNFYPASEVFNLKLGYWLEEFNIK
jgi:hypothetical protein